MTIKKIVLLIVFFSLPILSNDKPEIFCKNSEQAFGLFLDKAQFRNIYLTEYYEDEGFDHSSRQKVKFEKTKEGNFRIVLKDIVIYEITLAATGIPYPDDSLTYYPITGWGELLSFKESNHPAIKYEKKYYCEHRLALRRKKKAPFDKIHQLMTNLLY